MDRTVSASIQQQNEGWSGAEVKAVIGQYLAPEELTFVSQLYDTFGEFEEITLTREIEVEDEGTSA